MFKESKRSSAPVPTAPVAPVSKNKRKDLASAPFVASSTFNPANPLLIIQQSYCEDFIALYGTEDPAQVDFSKVTTASALAFYKKHESLLLSRDFQVPKVFLTESKVSSLATLMYCMAFLVYQRSRMNLTFFGSKP